MHLRSKFCTKPMTNERLWPDIVVFIHIHPLSCDWMVTGLPDAYPPVPLSPVHRWPFKQRNGNVIFPSACHNSPRLVIHFDWKESKDILHQRQSGITLKQSAGIHLLQRWAEQKPDRSSALSSNMTNGSVQPCFSKPAQTFSQTIFGDSFSSGGRC